MLDAVTGKATGVQKLAVLGHSELLVWASFRFRASFSLDVGYLGLGFIFGLSMCAGFFTTSGFLKLLHPKLTEKNIEVLCWGEKSFFISEE